MGSILRIVVLNSTKSHIKTLTYRKFLAGLSWNCHQFCHAIFIFLISKIDFRFQRFFIGKPDGHLRIEIFEMYRITLFVCAFCFSLSTFAQDTDTIKTTDLSEVIVTGQYQPQTTKNSVYQVKVIQKNRIQQQGATNLQNVLNTELNIRFSQDMATGGGNITFNGMSGQNVKILVDGVPLMGRQGFNNEININQININTVERIELIEGPMSVIYGADALGGVINIITTKKKSEGLNVTAKIHEETIGDEYNWFNQGIHNQSLSATYKKNNWEVGGNIGYNYYGGWKDTAVGRELLWHKKDQIIGAAYLGYTAPRWNVRYRLDGLDEIIYNPGNFTLRQQATGDTLAIDQEYLSNRVMHQLHGGYKFSEKFSLQSQAAYTDYSRQVYTTSVSKATGAVRYYNAPGQNTIEELKGFTFRTTGVYKINNRLSLQPGIDINTESATGERLSQSKNSVEDYAGFLTAEWIVTDKFKVRPGLRVVHNSVYDAPPVIPSVNLKWDINEMLDFRASYANGFRSPSIRELYFNFFDANHQILGNPDLKAEMSNTFNASFNWKKVVPEKVVYTTVISGFYNLVENMIDYAPSASDPNVFILTNVSKSKTAGINLQSVAKYKRCNAGIGFAYTGFYNADYEADKSLSELQWNLEANAQIGYNIEKIGLDLNFFYKITGKQPYYTFDNNQSKYLKAEYESYHMADFTANKKIGQYLNLQMGVRNLFDVTGIKSQIQTGGAITDHRLRSLANGRSYFASITFNGNLFQNKK